MKKNKIYQHYRGGLYELLFTALCHASGERVAIYKSQQTGVIWSRNLHEFQAKFKEVDNG